MIRQRLKSLLNFFPYVKELHKENEVLRDERNELRWKIKDLDALFVPPGHYYSPIPPLDEIKKSEDKLFEKIPQSLKAIELNVADQLRLLESLTEHYAHIPFPVQKKEGFRFYFDNPNFRYADAVFLYLMICHVKPKRIIEVGSGYSSCLCMDTNDMCFNSEILLKFFEPYPELFLSLITEQDKKTADIVPKKFQDVESDEFMTLDEGDILFIDSTHVSRINSDVNHLFFEILPSLKKGVYVHLHDIFYPFEYPKDWVYEGRAWNESYILRAFLQYNSAFKIALFPDFLQRVHADKLGQHLPLTQKSRASSIWLQKL